MLNQISLDISNVDLGAMLIECVAGAWEREAATRLVVEHGVWLSNAKFRAYIAQDSETGAVGILWYDLEDAIASGVLYGSAEDIVALRIASGFVTGSKYPVNEIESVSPLTLTAIMRSIAINAGYGSMIDDWCPLVSV